MATATERDGGGNAERLREHARAAQREGQALADSARGALDALRALARERVETQPYATLAAVFGAGWILGGGLPLRAVVFVGGLGARIAAQELLRSLRPPAAPDA